MKAVIGLATVGILIAVAGCTYPERQTAYRTSGYTGVSGNDVVSANSTTPPVYTSPSYGSSGVYDSGPLGTNAHEVYNAGPVGTYNTNTTVYSSSGPYPATTPGPAASSSEADQQVVSRINNELSRYGSLADAARNVTLSSRFGTVTLGGAVASQQQKQMIVALVRNTPGVVSVNDQLIVSSVAAPTGSSSQSVYPSENNTAGSGTTSGTATSIVTPATGDMFSLHVQGLNQTDRDVAQRIINGLRSDTTLVQLVPKVSIDVANGQVTLRGSVQNDQQRRTIGTAVERATGAPVQNELQVTQMTGP